MNPRVGPREKKIAEALLRMPLCVLEEAYFKGSSGEGVSRYLDGKDPR